MLVVAVVRVGVRAVLVSLIDRFCFFCGVFCFVVAVVLVCSGRWCCWLLLWVWSPLFCCFLSLFSVVFCPHPPTHHHHRLSHPHHQRRPGKITRQEQKTTKNDMARTTLTPTRATPTRSNTNNHQTTRCPRQIQPDPKISGRFQTRRRLDLFGSVGGSGWCGGR